jgi:ABC-type cobalamin/Fe3+-siderophores transport system ATPase subunit
MRLLRVYIDGYRNLKNVTVDFDKDSLTTVVIGENGSGKSNLIEAIVEVFRAWDLGRPRILKFSYTLEYSIKGKEISVNSADRRPLHPTLSELFDEADEPMGGPYAISLPNQPYHSDTGVGRWHFNYVPKEYLPDLVFGYYSGTSRRLETLFDSHQLRYYGVINKERPEPEYGVALGDRRLFYCRPIHGVIALLSYLAKPGKDGDVNKLLTEKLGITGFHSALAHFKEPSWFPGSKVAAAREASNVWGAHGPAGKCAHALKDAAFHPLKLEGAVVDDYRRKASKEAQLACFLRDTEALKAFAANYETDQDMFAALEAADISDLFRDMIVWVTRTNDDSGDISFSDLSDGERQLLMVLGLIRVSRGKEALFLLDEPDTHLNPAWQLTYLDLIREWTEVAADEDKCQIIMTSHNPLTIAALTKKEVRVMNTEENGDVTAKEPYADPRGMGFTSTLTEIFGLPSTLDPKTQEQIDERNVLARIDERSADQEKQLIEINDKLNRLGFMNESREPLYQDFLKAWQDVRYADKPPLTPDQIEARHLAMQALIKQLTEGKETAH